MSKGPTFPPKLDAKGEGERMQKYLTEVVLQHQNSEQSRDGKSLERYFGKLGVMECSNVIILCEDAEVME